MPYKCSIEHEPGCMYFRFNNISCLEQLEMALQLILDVYHTEGITNVLIDLSSQKDTLGMMDLYNISMEIANSDLHHLRFATYSRQTNLAGAFITSVAGKTGSRVRMFKSERAARSWLFRQPAITAA